MTSGGGKKFLPPISIIREEIMTFLDKFQKGLAKDGFETGAAKPPRYWFSTGNYVLNRIISGSFYKGIPQGRVMSLAGPSGAGKSFLASNLIRNAQEEEAWNALLELREVLRTRDGHGLADHVCPGGALEARDGPARQIGVAPEAKWISCRMIKNRSGTDAQSKTT